MRSRIFIICFVLALLSACDDTTTTNTSQDTPLITASAEVVSMQTATIGPPNVRRMWQYKIEKMVPENTRVKEGDMLLVFDAQRLKTDLIGRKSSLQAEIKKAQSQKLDDEATEHDLVLAQAEAQMNYDIARRKAEITDESRSQIERDKQQADFEYQSEKLAQAKQKLAHHKKAREINQKVSQGRINMYRSRVNSIESDIEKLTVKAPKDGLVMYVNWNNEKPAVGETVYMGRSLLTLPSLDHIAIKVEFDEPDTDKLHVGQLVKVVFEAYPETAYMGKISELAEAYHPKSANNPKVVFDALVELDNDGPKEMRPGMKAKVEVMP
ncbi:efflux RND transporter periplasmic adaptor subunit [Neptunicella marina]|uniref:Efflux RND transporter periplasmic adaptor subunit n=2 Tax=Neptunicella marina TaxID=2125989 RepID=A0A8J6M0I3_9ALTE|nr:efflux RND transporter periplasmic adaptor subunit [Neptunicella marina]